MLRRDLLSGSLASFAARRDAAAAELSAAGHRTDAAALRRLKRPAASLWAVNQLARADRAAVTALLEAAEVLRREQHAASSPNAARAAIAGGRALRARVQDLGDHAARLLADSGSPVTAPTRARIHATLLGVIGASRDERRALLAGALDHELAPPALSDVLAAMPVGQARGGLRGRAGRAGPATAGLERPRAIR